MSNYRYDVHLEREHARNEGACCECGFFRNGRHHPKILCSKTGRCGDCGNDWPCAEHAPRLPEREPLRPLAGVKYDANMNMAWRLGQGLDDRAELPASLEDVVARARFVDEIDGPMVRDFSSTIEDICTCIGRHISMLAAATAPPLFPHEVKVTSRVAVALRLWGGCISAVKTIAYKTAAGKNKDANRGDIMAWIDSCAATDAVYRAGVEAAPAFKRLRHQRVYFTGIDPGSAVMRYAHQLGSQQTRRR